MDVNQLIDAKTVFTKKHRLLRVAVIKAEFQSTDLYFVVHFRIGLFTAQLQVMSSCYL